MRGNVRRTWNDDAGMTLIEIIVASAILFVILTGVLGLVLQTTRMSVQAKEQTMLANAVSAYTERLNTYTFEQVALDTEVGGELQAEHTDTTTFPGYTIIYRPTVTPGDNSALKNVRVDVEIIRADGWTHEMSTSLVIRDRTQFLTQASANPDDKPIVSFTGLTPPDKTVVWNSQHAGGGALVIAATAQAAEGRVIDTASYWIDGQRVCMDSLGNRAEWIVGTNSWSESAFTWSTKQNELDPFGAVAWTVPDGMRTIEVQVIDDAGASGSTTRYFLVDNEPPPTPDAPAGIATSATSAEVSWTAVSDGTLPAHGYRIEVARQTETDPLAWWRATPVGLSVTDASYPLATDAFRRYAARVQAFSPRDLSNDWSAWGVPFESRPRLGGTYTVEKKNGQHWKVTANLTVTPPKFPTTGTTNYSLHRVVGGELQSPPVYSGPLNTFTDTVQVNQNPKLDNFPQTVYAVVVTYTPSGYGGGTQKTIRSNSILTAYQDAAATYTYAEGTW